jgi:hypothetical protein
MQEEVTAAVAKAASGAAISAAFALTPWAVVAAIVGAAVSLHFQEASGAKGVGRLVLGIGALGFLAAMIAAGVPHAPGFGWTDAIPVAVRAGFLGVVADPTHRFIIRPAIVWFGGRFGQQQGG